MSAEQMCRKVMGVDKWKMKVGRRLRHTNGRMCKIVDGQYFSNGRLSNIWSWRYVGKRGKLGPTQHGYGWC